MQGFRPCDEPERRRKTRFPIGLVARYTVQRPHPIEGAGLTVNISSNGVLMTSANQVSPGTSIRIVIEWPILIGNVCPLALHIRGTVVRSARSLVAVRFSTYEFRTRPKLPKSTGAAPRSGIVAAGPA
jgi:PilZ domain